MQPRDTRCDMASVRAAGGVDDWPSRVYNDDDYAFVALRNQSLAAQRSGAARSSDAAHTRYEYARRWRGSAYGENSCLYEAGGWRAAGMSRRHVFNAPQRKQR